MNKEELEILHNVLSNKRPWPISAGSFVTEQKAHKFY